MRVGLVGGGGGGRLFRSRSRSRSRSPGWGEWALCWVWFVFGAVRCLVFWLGIDGYKGERKEEGREEGRKEGRKERGHERKESWNKVR